MAEYIEREAALKALKIAKGYCPCAYDEVKRLPAADVAQVVRCKDCKRYHAGTGWCDEHSCFIDNTGEPCSPTESDNWKMFKDDDFCSYGERRDKEGVGVKATGWMPLPQPPKLP